jgi:LmbE family N-acetylglucosaminyl deacetylase
MNSGRMSGYGERVLFIGAHPDDIEIGCGGTAAKFIGEGKAIAFAIASFHPVDGKIREAEAKEAASKLGLSEAGGTLFFGRISEATFSEEKGQLRTWMKKVASEFQPDTVFAHRRDGHDHHTLVCEIANGCFGAHGFYEFYIPRTEPEPAFAPTAFIDIEHYIDKKVEMCKCHQTQKEKYIGEDAVKNTAHFYYLRCDAVHADWKVGYVEAFNTVRALNPLAAREAAQLSTGSQAVVATLIPNALSSPQTSVGVFVRISRALRIFKAERFVGEVRRRASLSYLTYLHEDVVHSMRKFALACEYCGSTDEWDERSWEVFGPAARDFCTASRKLFCDLAELEDNEIHCCVKLIVKSESVVTWARSQPADIRDETIAHPINQNSVWSALLGRNDGRRTWPLFNCFSSADLVKHISQFSNTRPDWLEHYRSVLVFPLRYANRRSTTNFDTFGFFALDSKKANAFAGMPDIFEYIEDRDVYHDRARKCAMFQAGAAIADNLSMFLRPVFLNYAQSSRKNL